MWNDNLIWLLIMTEDNFDMTETVSSLEILSARDKLLLAEGGKRVLI